MVELTWSNIPWNVSRRTLIPQTLSHYTLVRKVENPKRRISSKVHLCLSKSLDSHNWLRQGYLPQLKTSWYAFISNTKRLLHWPSQTHIYDTRMDACLYTLGEVCVCTTLGASLRFFQNKLDDWQKTKTTFSYHHELYKFVQGLLGQRNLQSTFESTIDMVLSRAKVAG